MGMAAYGEDADVSALAVILIEEMARFVLVWNDECVNALVEDAPAKRRREAAAAAVVLVLLVMVAGLKE